MESKKVSPKDIFLHLLVILTLYISVISLITLLFQYINVLFPDELRAYYPSIAAPIRWSMASLIIVFPVFMAVSWLLRREYKQEPAKLELQIRKWLIYFTLFIAAITIIIDLVRLVYNFLEGDLTASFVSKVSVILLVVGAVFGYYLADLRNKLGGKKQRLIAIGVSAIVFISVAVGFFTVGSPLKARLYRFDEQKINHLQLLQGEIINYWVQKDELPGTLSDLRNDITGFAPPADPQSRAAYEYRTISDLSFELCAEFNLPSVGQAKITAPVPYYESPYQQNWDHDAGRTCFERTIDPDFYADRGAPKLLR